MDPVNISRARASYKPSESFRGSHKEFMISSLSFCWQRSEIDDGMSTMRQVHRTRAKTHRQEQKKGTLDRLVTEFWPSIPGHRRSVARFRMPRSRIPSSWNCLVIIIWNYLSPALCVPNIPRILQKVTFSISG
ncbi:uncharacterized protein LOC118645301 [Monomorium pharaonis]|uniref:uncharacterized protein LOC118645301 n=1 Tax=Monomorium pharaonis TaxID=307658 RepID=UPI001745CEFC|nr:uncharacterized protein LOC118645301 [Monomorium pharaonis]